MSSHHQVITKRFEEKKRKSFCDEKNKRVKDNETFPRKAGKGLNKILRIESWEYYERKKYETKMKNKNKMDKWSQDIFMIFLA